ncbi:MAG: DUF1467 family protein [Hyphomicrobiaceae bacterium]|nr:DUF1467 family protein [Hyphomicrobiaceae bacterium]
MQISTLLAIYFVMWWITLFTILPIRVRTQEEAGEVVPGTTASAPAQPMLLKKMLWTTLVSAVLFAIASAIHVLGGIGMEDILFLPKR